MMHRRAVLEEALDLLFDRYDLPFDNIFGLEATELLPSGWLCVI
jgi:hypothetical protein